MNNIQTPQTPKAPHILVVDDTPANVQLLIRMLTDRGHSPRAVLSGELALQSARADLPELILLDINMPKMNGFEVCRQLKADPALRDIPVIFISALHEVDEKVKAFAVGGVDYVTKPFQLSEISARVEVHLKLRALQRQLGEHNDRLEFQVVQRTRELTKAYERMHELNRLKDDFFSMISHEMRTPAGGVLGFGELLISLCPESDDRTLFADMFTKSAERLSKLLDDVVLLTDLDAKTPQLGKPLRVVDLLVQVQGVLPELAITIDHSAALDASRIKGHEPHLKSSLATLVLLATFFSRNAAAVHLVATLDASRIRLRIELDNFLMSNEQAQDYFVIGSSARSSSRAETMGLAPVVAHQIITATGGELKLVKLTSSTGYLEASFPKHTESALS